MSEVADDDFGSDIDLDEELQDILQQAESGVIESIEPSEAIIVSASVDDVAEAGLPALQDGSEVVREVSGLIDIEDTDFIMREPRISPFLEFRKKGWLSVSDLVGGIWCEVQYDYRLRSLPHLPPEKRPEVITSKEGKSIPMDKVKVEDKEKILQRGQKIHKRLEREIHPEEILVKAVSREDVWGLRFLNMFSGMESLLSIGKCREMPVVGFINGMLVMGIVDEITRQAIVPTTNPPPKTRSKTQPPDPKQPKLSSFFTSTPSPSKAKAPSFSAPPRPVKKERTHRLFISDSKTRASGVVPRESDTTAGKLQCMLYKELFDGLLLAPVREPYHDDMTIDEQPEKEQGTQALTEQVRLPTDARFTWERLFSELGLDMSVEFSDDFVKGSKAIVLGNGIRYGVDDIRTLSGLVDVWRRYVEALGLGDVDSTNDGDRSTETNGLGQVVKVNASVSGRSEDRLELVYRRAGVGRKGKGKAGTEADQTRKPGARRKGKRRRKESDNVSNAGMEEAPVIIVDTNEVEEDLAIQIAIEASLREVSPDLATTELPATGSLGDADGTDRTPLAERPMTLSEEEKEREDDELAWAVEMSLGVEPEIEKEEPGEIILRTSQPIPVGSPPSSPLSSPPPPASSTIQVEKPGSKSGSIIGKTVFKFDRVMLEEHLKKALGWWTGVREAEGVSEEDVRRCGWCEFEEGCEWRAKKAEEAMDRYRARIKGV